MLDAEVDPIAPPEIDITSGEESGAVAFDAVVQVRPTVAIPGYEGLRVTIPSLAVTDEEIDAQVTRLRENEGELVTADRPAVDGDHVTIDIHGTSGGQEVLGADDFLYEVGSGSVGARARHRAARVDPRVDTGLLGHPARRRRRRLPGPGQGGTARRSCPAPPTSGPPRAPSSARCRRCRDDIDSRMARVKVVQSQMALRENALGALVELVDDEEVPEVMVEEEVQQRVHDLSHRLEQQRVTLDQLLAATGRTGDELLAEVRGEAFRTVKADLALRAVADAQELTVTDEELDAEVAAMAERMEVEPGALRAQLDRGGRTDRGTLGAAKGQGADVAARPR